MNRRALTLLLAGGVLGCTAAPAGAVSIYVALGDSYTAGPLILTPKGSPIDCGRSDHNYPTLVANQIKPGQFRDVSCGSAQTKDMTGPQTGLPLGGTNAPQFNALSADVDLVTVGIGGNDMGFGSVVSECVGRGTQSLGQGAPCTAHFAPGGQDSIARRLAEVVAPRVTKVVQDIQARAPSARVVLVGDPNPVPPAPGCYPFVPIAAGDLPYLKTVAEGLRDTKAKVADATGAEFVDLIPGSLGHDICAPIGTRWYEGIVPTAPAYPAHPNVLGMEFAAREVLKVLGRPPRNDLAIVTRRATSTGSLRLTLRAPSRGTFVITTRARGSAYARQRTVPPSRAGIITASLKPTAKQRRALRRAKRSTKVSISVAFTPVAGTKRTERTSLRVKARRARR